MAGQPELQFRWDGPEQGSVLAMAHSIGSSMAMWEPQVPALSRKLRVLRYDHRGHGGSPVPPGPYTIAELGRDFIALLDRLQLQRVSFCGLSLGGMVGMWLGANAPDRIDRLILCCTTPRMMRPEDFAARATKVRKEGMGSIADVVISRWFTPGFAASHAETVASIRKLFVSTPAEGYASGCEALAAMDLRGELGKIKAPTLVIGAVEDQSTPLQQQREIVSGIRGARLEIVENAAHLANIQQPEAFTHLILAQSWSDDA
jgi:3-oxoadipate enol-lactonase